LPKRSYGGVLLLALSKLTHPIAIMPITMLIVVMSNDWQRFNVRNRKVAALWAWHAWKYPQGPLADIDTGSIPLMPGQLCACRLAMGSPPCQIQEQPSK